MATLLSNTVIKSADGQTTYPVVSSNNIGSYGLVPSSTYYIGTSQLTFNRSSASQTLAGVSIDGNAATASTSTQFAGEANTNFIRGLSSGTQANLDTYTDNGFRSISYTGYSKGLLSFSMGGSSGSIQHEYHYNIPLNGWRVRNKTDSTTWSSWGNVVMTDTNQGALTGTVITTGNSSGLSPTFSNIYAGAFYDSADSNFYLDPANSTTSLLVAGKVGIGTTSPATKLTVYVGSGEISGTNDAIRLQVASYASTARNTIVWAQDTNNLVLARYGLEWNGGTSRMNFVWRDVYNSGAGSTELMRLTGDGNLGIGSTSPAYKLDVNGGIGISGAIFVDKSGAYTRIFEGAGNPALYLGNNSDPANYYDNTNHYIRNRGGSSNYVVINSSGNVGIGTDTPPVKLDVRGVMQSQNYILPDTSGTAQWIKLGRLTIPQNGYTAHIRAYIHQGFNALNSQDFYLDIFFKTSNASSLDGNGFSGNSWYYTRGFNAVDVTPKWVGNAAGVSATAYDLYLYLPIYTSKSHYVIEMAEGVTWSHTGTTGQVNPGNGSSTVCVSSVGFNIPLGSVGIGTVSPSYKLDVTGSARFTTTIYAAKGVLTDSSGANPVLEVYNTVATNATTAIIRQTTAGGNGNQDIGLLVDIQGAGDSDRIANFRYYDGSTYTSRMAILRGGSVGIGTTSPSAKLDINGNFAAAGTSVIGTAYPQLTLNGTTNQHAYLFVNRTNYEGGIQFQTSGATKWWAYMGSGDDTKLRFYASGADRMVIQNDGVVIASGDFRAPVFYDSDNTAYYINPASTSNLNIVNLGGITGAGGAYIQSTTTGTSYTSHFQIREASGGSGSTNEIYAPALGFHWSGRVASNILIEASGRISIRDNPGTSYENFIAAIVYASSSLQAPIFYDSNDTNYYIDPAGATSAIFAGKVIIKGTSQISSGTVSILAGGASGVGWGTGLNIGDTSNYTSFIQDGGVSRWRNFGTGGYDWYGSGGAQRMSLTDAGVLTGNVDIRSPIFYDSNDTSYYIDGASTSVLNKLKVDGGNYVYDYYQSASDFANGTLVTTDIDASGTNGESFVMNVIGKSYSSSASPFNFTVQGYLYNNGIINYTGIKLDSTGLTTVKIFNNGGYLCFWWARIGYWHSFEVSVRAYNSAKSNMNRVTSVTDAVEPTGSKKVTVTLQSFLRADASATNSVDLRAPIFYDSDDSGYYLDPAGTSIINTLQFAANTAQIIGNTSSTYGSIELRGSRNGWRGIHFYGGGNTPHLMFDGSANGGVYFEYGGTWASYYNHTNNCWGFGTSTTNSAYNLYAPTGIYSGGRVDGTIFYDTNDTTYYCNPSNVSNIIELKTNQTWYDGSATSWGGGINMGGNNPSIAFQSTASTWWYMFHHASNNINFYRRSTTGGWNQDCIWDSSGNFIWRTSSIRAPIFYDFDDTGYYVNPASTSSMYLIKTYYNSAASIANSSFNVGKTILGGLHFNNGSGTAGGSSREAAITFQGSTADEAQAGIYVSNNSSEGTHMAFATTDDYGAGPQIGLRIMNNGLSVFPRSYVQAAGSFRAPIFYDSNDTNYYIDPAGTSSINTVTGVNYYASSWFRNTTSGAGLYSEANGNHFYSDSANGWNISCPNSTSWLRFRTGGHGGTIRGWIYADTGPSFGFLDSSGNWKARVVNDDYFLVDGSSARAQIFYDSNDTNYYTNPAGTSVLSNLTLGDGNVQLYKSQTVDMSNTTVYSTGNYYPVTISVPMEGCIIEIQNHLNSNVPTWATHPGGFSLALKWRTNGAGWGTSIVRRVIEQYSEAWTNATICGGITQMTNSSIEVVWLRGGGQYLFKFSRNLTATAQSSTYTVNSQSVTPTSSAQNTIWNSANGNWTIYNDTTSSSSNMYTPVLYDYNNSAYWCDPSSASNFVGLTVANTIAGSISGNAATVTNGAYVNASQTFTNVNYFLSNKGATSTVGANNSYAIQAYSNDAGAAGMSFHRGGYYAVNMGLDPDNILRIGGWSAVSNRWELDMSGNNWAASSFRAPIFYDSNDTNYYVDPSSDSILNTINGMSFSKGANNVSTNMAVGYQSLASNTTGVKNTSIGYQNLNKNTTGSDNVSVGYQALYNNTAGYANNAFGYRALYNNTNGGYNISIGQDSLSVNTGGSYNVAIGHESMFYNTTGAKNTAVGDYALNGVTTGTTNSCFGYNAGSSITTGTNNTCIGNNAQASTATSSNSITLGNSSIATLRCQVTTITALSDLRDKAEINNVQIGLSFIEKLRPVTFKWDKREWYKNGIRDGSKKENTLNIGFIAQELKDLQETENAEYLKLVYENNPDKLEATPGNLLVPLIKAVQELSAQNRVMRAEIDYLKTKIQ